MFTSLGPKHKRLLPVQYLKGKLFLCLAASRSLGATTRVRNSISSVLLFHLRTVIN